MSTLSTTEHDSGTHAARGRVARILLSAGAVFQFLSWLWRPISDRIGALWLVRVNLLIALGFGLAFIFVPQIQDVLRVLAEDAYPPRILYTVGAAVVLAWILWYWSRAIEYFDFANHKQSGRTWFRQKLPRLIGAGFLALMGVAHARAAFEYGQGETRVPAILWGLALLYFALAALLYYVLHVRRRRLGGEYDLQSKFTTLQHVAEKSASTLILMISTPNCVSS